MLPTKLDFGKFTPPVPFFLTSKKPVFCTKHEHVLKEKKENTQVSSPHDLDRIQLPKELLKALGPPLKVGKMPTSAAQMANSAWVKMGIKPEYIEVKLRAAGVCQEVEVDVWLIRKKFGETVDTLKLISCLLNLIIPTG